MKKLAIILGMLVVLGLMLSACVPQQQMESKPSGKSKTIVVTGNEEIEEEPEEVEEETEEEVEEEEIEEEVSVPISEDDLEELKSDLEGMDFEDIGGITE